MFDVFDVFNNRHRLDLNRDLELALDATATGSDFLRFVGAGQPSVLHLARFIHNALVGEIAKKVSAIAARTDRCRRGKGSQLHNIWNGSKNMRWKRSSRQFLLPSCNPEVHDPTHPEDSADLPDLLRLSPKALLTRLLSLHSSSRFTLNLSNLTIQDTLELLYTCEGMISHIETYNLKTAAHGMICQPWPGAASFAGEAVDLKSPEKHYRLISDLQQALNEDNVITLKRAIRAIIWDYEEQRLQLKKHVELLPAEQLDQEKLDDEYERMLERKQQLVDILYNLETFHNYYSKRILGSRIGSGSTGQAEDQYGMGLVVLDTLPARAKKRLPRKSPAARGMLLPVSALLTRHSHSRSHDPAKTHGKRGFWEKLQVVKACGRSAVA